MQQYFNDSTDVGKLFINYPMIESYQHFSAWPNEEFEHTSISVTLQPGDRYKNLVKDTRIAKQVELPKKMEEILSERFGIADFILCKNCVEQILCLQEESGIEEK